MQWKISRLDDIDGSIWHNWHKLAADHHRNNPMLCSEFVELLAKYFGKNLFVAQAEDSGQLVALCLLESTSTGIWRVFKPGQAQICLWVGKSRLQPKDLNALVSAIPGLVLKLDLFGLDPLEHQHIIDAVPQNMQEQHDRDISIQVDKGFDDYWADRPRKMRQNVNRYQNRVKREIGDYEVDYVFSLEQILEATDLYGMLESRGWKGTQGTALHPSNTQGQFYREYMQLMAAKGQAFVASMRLGGDLVASRLCVFNNEILVTLKTTFNEDFRKHAVGRILLKEVLEYVFEHQLTKVVDFYTDATSDQMDWATHDRYMVNATVYSPNKLFAVLPLLVRLKSKLKANPLGEKKH